MQPHFKRRRYHMSEKLDFAQLLGIRGSVYRLLDDTKDR